MVQEKVNVNLKSLVFALLFLAVLILLLVGLLSNGDPLWFLPVFNETPSKITVMRAGCKVDLVEGDSGFAELTRAINQSLPQYEGYSGQFGMSADSEQNYRTKENAVEVFYAGPVTVHSPYEFGHPDSLFIPTSGPLAETRSVFGGHNGDYWAGALRLKSIQAIQQAADAVPCS